MPGTFPHLLVNGTTGIAVAMASNHLPHNIGEIMDAIQATLLNPNITAKEVMQYIHGPDFPTGGIVINQQELEQAYATGKGKVKVRGEYNIETYKKHQAIIFTSIPYKVSKEDLIIKIDKLCEEEKITGITKIRDESNKDGVRFVIELEKGVYAEDIIDTLFNLTDLETSYAYNMVVLEDKKPKLLNMPQMLNDYIKHQKLVLKKSTEYKKQKIEKELHILKGLLIALEDIDNIIQLIKKSDNSTQAREKLMINYSLTEEQSTAIVNMKLGSLAKLEKTEINKKAENLTEKLNEANDILTKEEKVKTVLYEKFNEIKNKYKDDRRTIITQLNIEKPKKKADKNIIEDCTIIIDHHKNTIKRILKNNSKESKRAQNGKLQPYEERISTNTDSNLYIYTNIGKVMAIPIKKLSEGKILNIHSLLSLDLSEKILYIGTMEQDLIIITKLGNGKILRSSDSITKTTKGTTYIKLKENDEVIGVLPKQDFIIYTSNGLGLCLKAEQLSEQGKAAIGAKAINLSDNNTVSAVSQYSPNIILLTSDGLIKRINLTDFSFKNRGAKGSIIAHDCIISAIPFNEDISVKTEEDIFTIKTNDIPEPATKKAKGKIILKGQKITELYGG